MSLQGLREEWKGSSGGRSQQNHPTAPEAFRGLYRAGLRKKKKIEMDVSKNKRPQHRRPKKKNTSKRGAGRVQAT